MRSCEEAELHVLHVLLVRTTAALRTLDVAGGLNQPLRRDISAPADPIDRRDHQAHHTCQHSSNTSSNASSDASFLGAQSGTCDRRSHRKANAGRDAGGSRAEPLCQALAGVLRLGLEHFLLDVPTRMLLLAVRCCRVVVRLGGATRDMVSRTSGRRAARRSSHSG